MVIVAAVQRGACPAADEPVLHRPGHGLSGPLVRVDPLGGAARTGLLAEDCLAKTLHLGVFHDDPDGRRTPCPAIPDLTTQCVLVGC